MRLIPKAQMSLLGGRRTVEAVLAVVLALAVALSVMVWMSRGNFAPEAVRQPAQVTSVDTGSGQIPASIHGRQILP
jgi:hypothetical protein